MTAVQLMLPMPGVAPAVLTLPQPLSAPALQALEQAVAGTRAMLRRDLQGAHDPATAGWATSRQAAGEIEYASWLPDAGAIEYASWVPFVPTLRQ
jgi:hypothetical protein